MKKNFPMVLLKIGGIALMLSIAAFVLMMIVKLLISILVLAGIGGLIFKFAKKRRRHLLEQSYNNMLPIVAQSSNTHSKIQPLYNNAKGAKTIIPIL